MYLKIVVGPVDDYGRETLWVQWDKGDPIRSHPLSPDRNGPAKEYQWLLERIMVGAFDAPTELAAWEFLINALPSPHKERAEALLLKFMENKLLGAGQ